MYIDSVDPYDGGGSWGGGGGSGSGSGSGEPTGGNDPTTPPRWTPGGHGWWEFVRGAWRWMTEAPRAITTP